MANLLERITINPEQCGGRPCIRGMRIRVIDVLWIFNAHDLGKNLAADFQPLNKSWAETASTNNAA